ncbi:hypothetical protein D7044_09630 [Micromonospora musae]|uniref:Secreted protein n=1 Tax=Micromonospora musae TaxID=1894970 RepID=A0A3A9Y8Y5_9ACTN|nr:hypothetical protein D7044_09630 [Micromonospora musae]
MALGGGALLLGTPAAAHAAPYEQASDRTEVACANTVQTNKVSINQIISDNKIEDSDVSYEQSASVETTNDNQTQPNNTVVCIGNIDVDVDVED